jgi:hypothetical protein
VTADAPRRDQLGQPGPAADQFVAKYWENATTAVSDSRAEAIRDAVLGLDAQPDARAFAAVLAGVPV